MRSLGSSAVKPAFLLVPIAALTFALSGGAAASTALPGRAAAHGVTERWSADLAVAAGRVTWHKLPLLNGWHSAGSNYGTGDPAWAVGGGIVYLSGSIIEPTGSSTLFGRLPAAARPARVLYITVYTLGGTTGYLTIYADGLMDVRSTPFSDAQGYTSLAAISFPAKATGGHKLTLLHGWQSSQGAYHTGDPSYSVNGGVVHLSGSLHQPAGSNTYFAVLPRAARPAREMFVSIYTFGGTVGQLIIYPSGGMRAGAGGAQLFTSLAAVSYRAGPVAQHRLRLIHGWKSAQRVFGTGDPSYSVAGGIVYLSGALSSGTNDEFAILPRAARPAHSLFIAVYAGGEVGVLLIRPTGQMSAYSQPPGNAMALTSLAAVSYPLRS